MEVVSMQPESEDELDEEASEDLNDIYDDEITSEDYGFVLDSEGNLKSVFMAEEYDIIPEKVYAVFKLFGIDDPDEVNRRVKHTIH